MKLEKPKPHEAIEGVLWTLAAFGILFMILSMPWVGPDRVIPGSIWLGISLITICLFGGSAMIIRVVAGPIFDRFDNDLERGLSR